VIAADRSAGHHRTGEALERVIRHYELVGNESAAARWRALRTEPTTRALEPVSKTGDGR